MKRLRMRCSEMVRLVVMLNCESVSLAGTGATGAPHNTGDYNAGCRQSVSAGHWARRDVRQQAVRSEQTRSGRTQITGRPCCTQIKTQCSTCCNFKSSQLMHENTPFLKSEQRIQTEIKFNFAQC